jgi:hypothetical protein
VAPWSGREQTVFHFGAERGITAAFAIQKSTAPLDGYREGEIKYASPVLVTRGR